MSVWSSPLKAWHSGARVLLQQEMSTAFMDAQRTSWKVTYAFVIPNVTKSGFLQRRVDFNVLRSSATCLHQVQPEMGTV